MLCLCLNQFLINQSLDQSLNQLKVFELQVNFKSKIAQLGNFRNEAPGSLPEGCYVEFSDVQGCDSRPEFKNPVDVGHFKVLPDLI